MFVQPLAQQIYETVTVNPHLNQAGLMFQANVNEGRVVLRGSVRSFYEKQIAQEAVREIEGVKIIENQIEVAE
jgi:osmotically-inducible protein OsmY